MRRSDFDRVEYEMECSKCGLLEQRVSYRFIGPGELSQIASDWAKGHKCAVN